MFFAGLAGSALYSEAVGGLNVGMSGRAAGIPESRDFLHRFVTAAEAAGFSVACYGEAADGTPLIVARRLPAEPRLSVVISAGVHGDEPAGPLALLRWISAGIPDPGVAWTVFPLINPTGWDDGTREARSGLDLNRDYYLRSQPETRAHVDWMTREGGRFDWAVCLHEDWEAKGFYLYEVLVGQASVSIGRAILRQVEPVIGIDTSAEIDGMPAGRGLITPAGDLSSRGSAWPEALWLANGIAPVCHTMETPSGAPLATRMAAHVTAIRAGLAEMLRPVIEDDFVI